MNKNYTRRSITIPKELDEIIKLKYKRSTYTFINDLIVELLELGLIKYDDNMDIKSSFESINNKLDQIINGF